MRKKGSQSGDRELLLAAAARLRQAERSQLQIAIRLNRSQSEVSRLLKEAEDRGILKTTRLIVKEGTDDRGIDEAIWEQVEREYFHDDSLAKKLREWLPKTTENQAMRFSVQVFEDSDGDSHAASASVLDLLKQVRLLGVMWGRTLQKLVNGIERFRAGGFDALSLQCIPLCGDPIHTMNLENQEFSASQLAARLEKVLCAPSDKQLPSLTGVPAYISTRLRRKAGEVFQAEYLEGIPGFVEIFGGGRDPKRRPAPLLGIIDTVLTGVGIIDVEGANTTKDTTAAFLRERIHQEGITHEELNRIVFGDIGGWLVPRPRITSKERKLVDELNNGWTCVKQSDLQRVARVAEKAPGMIVVASGARKSELVRHIVELGMANELIIDEDLAAALEAM
jgi:DNA-binding transcriptional regulator LsrR (DeoR family)